MKIMICAFLVLILVTPVVLAQSNDEVNPQKLVTWMRLVNTFEFEYKMAHGRFADAEELFAYAKTRKAPANPAFAGVQLSQGSMQPYVLRLVTDANGSHYSTKLEFPSDIQNKSTWCKTAVFSDDSGLISLGQNIQCTGASALGGSSSPIK